MDDYSKYYDELIKQYQQAADDYTKELNNNVNEYITGLYNEIGNLNKSVPGYTAPSIPSTPKNSGVISTPSRPGYTVQQPTNDGSKPGYSFTQNRIKDSTSGSIKNPTATTPKNPTSTTQKATTTAKTPTVKAPTTKEPTTPKNPTPKVESKKPATQEVKTPTAKNSTPKNTTTPTQSPKVENPTVTPSAPVTSPSSPVDVNVSYAEIENTVSMLQKAINELKTNWQQVINTNIAKIQSSWAGMDMQNYTENVVKMDKEVGNALDALKLLTETYQKAEQQIKAKQDEIAKKIKL